MALLKKRRVFLMLVSAVMSLEAFAIDVAKDQKKQDIKFVKAQPFKAPANEKEYQGMALYNQNCRLCHDPRLFRLKSDLRLPSAASSLVDIFEPPRSRSEQVFRQVVTDGIPTLMPSFRNSFNPEEFDALITYIQSL
ncbi:hypothetical protein R50073_08610 [Maricurvus nonylphenolicus]|uniref:c-type cytochrome n=1 Tax=Maricurvus nonylphenolicus TaxID=1008307 RepID=UPI0036F258C9